MNARLKIFGLVAFIIGYFVITAIQYSDCDDLGGAFVRGLFWFECIK